VSLCAYAEFVIRGSDDASHDQLTQATQAYLRHRSSAHRDSRIRILEIGARLPDTPLACEDELRISGFTYERVSVGEVTLNVASAGAGPPIVLLHGFPQTHLAWRHVATDLATDHRVICPDLRGYGDSDKPADDPRGLTYAKRTMATDIVELLRRLGRVSEVGGCGEMLCEWDEET
jgi:hypothetical protein